MQTPEIILILRNLLKLRIDIDNKNKYVFQKGMK